MSAMLSWASSVLGAMKSTVVNPFASDGNAVVHVKQTSSKRPDSKPGSAASKKKAAALKRRQRQRQRAAEESTSSSKEDGADEKGRETTSDQPAEQEDDEDAGSQNSASGEAVVTECADAPSSEPEAGLAASDARRAKEEKQRDKKLRRQARQREMYNSRKEMLANSLLNNLPVDELEAERKESLQRFRDRLIAIPAPGTEQRDAAEGADKTQWRMQIQNVQRDLTSLLDDIEDVSRSLTKRTPKVEDRSMNSNALRKLIQNIELSADKDESALAKRVDDLVKLLSAESHKDFLRRVEQLKEEVETRRKSNAKNLSATRLQEIKQRIISRLANLPGEAGLDLVREADLKYTPMDLSGQLQSVLFQPYNLGRKFERKFSVVIDAAPFPPKAAASGSSTSDPRRSNKNVTIWGRRANVEACVAYLTAGEQEEMQKKTYDKKVMGAVIGKGGAGLAQVEAGSDAFVIIDGVADILVFGPPAAKTQAWTLINKLIESQQDALASASLPVDTIVARAIQSLHRAKVQTLEQDIKGRVIVILNSSSDPGRRDAAAVTTESGIGVVVVKAKSETLEAAKEKVRRELVDGFRLIQLRAPGRAIARLLYAPKTLSESSEVRLIHEEFRALRESLALFVDRFGTRPAPGTPDKEDDQGGLSLVCSAANEDIARTKVTELIERASYQKERIPIEKEQLRIFTAENRALIESSSHCRFAVQSAAQGAAIILTGAPDALEEGKALVTDILQKKGGVVHHQISQAEVIPLLLRDKGAKIRALEYTNNVAITLDRNSATAKIVGDQEATENAIAAIEEICAERRELMASMKTASVAVPASCVAQIIGKGGATVNEIRQATGVSSINIPRQGSDADAGGEVSITVVGVKEAVAAAEKMIERIVTGWQSRGGRGSKVEASESPRVVGGQRWTGGGGLDPVSNPNQLFRNRRERETEDMENERDFPSIEIGKTKVVDAPPQAEHGSSD